jgi:hypothetical protein
VDRTPPGLRAGSEVSNCTDGSGGGGSPTAPRTPSGSLSPGARRNSIGGGGIRSPSGSISPGPRRTGGSGIRTPSGSVSLSPFRPGCDSPPAPEPHFAPAPGVPHPAPDTPPRTAPAVVSDWDSPSGGETPPPPAPLLEPIIPPREPSPAVSEDTLILTPGGTKRKRAPGSRLRTETRANKRRDLALYKDSIIQALHLPESPPGVLVAVTLAKKPAKKPVKKKPGRKPGRQPKK